MYERSMFYYIGSEPLGSACRWPERFQRERGRINNPSFRVSLHFGVIAVSINMDASIIVTYRCPMRCQMCNIWANPTRKSEEFKPELLSRLPRLNAVNVTGGEPAVREDLGE